MVCIKDVVQLCQLMMVRSRILGIRERGGLIISELNGERFYTWSFTKHLSTILHLSAEHRSSASRLRAPLNVRNGERTVKLETGLVSHQCSNFRGTMKDPKTSSESWERNPCCISYQCSNFPGTIRTKFLLKEQPATILGLGHLRE